MYEGEVVMTAPLVTLRGTDRALLGLNGNRTAEAVWSGAKATDFNDIVQFLASGETAGVLQAGETGGTVPRDSTLDEIRLPSHCWR
jgi:hypothetical protein